MFDRDCDLVSIVVPVYNLARTLGECLESARVQSYSNIEVIIVDDGSTDSSFAVASSFASRDPRFIVLRQNNAGVGDARNNALSHSRGSWVFFLDADDLLTPTCIEDLLAAADSSTDMVVGSIQKFRSILGTRRDAGIVRMDNKSYFLDGNSESLSALDEVLSLVAPKLSRRSVIESGDIRFGSIPYSEDHRFGLAFVAKGDGTVKTMDKVVYKYRCGGAASAVRFYPDMDLIGVSMLRYYRDICSSSSRILMDESFCQEAPARWLDGVLIHFCVCLPQKQARQRCLKAIEEFAAVGEPYKLNVDASSFYDEWLRSHRVKITAKRVLRSIRLGLLRG